MIRYIDYSAELIKDDDFFKKIATVAHNCYQVQGKSPDEVFVKSLFAKKHFAMSEHFAFHFLVDRLISEDLIQLNNPFILIDILDVGTLVTCSIRPLLEAKEADQVALAKLVSALPKSIQELIPWYEKETEKCVYLTSLDSLSLPPNVKRRHHFISVRIITDRGVSHELVRHRICSYAQESTRYCNYSKEKFFSSIAIMRPLDYQKYHEIYDRYYQEAEDGYFKMLEEGATPDVARNLLPNGLKTSIIMTCSLSEWDHIFELRLASVAHPDMRLTMNCVKACFEELGGKKDA